MSLHHTKTKGDLAVAKTIADLTEKGYSVFIPVMCEHLPFDLIAYKDKKSYRIQVKYSTSGRFCSNKSYNDSSFDYFAVYIPFIEKVIYPSIYFRNYSIAYKINNSASRFYWWEDFLEFTDKAERKQIFDFGIQMIQRKSSVRTKIKIASRKVDRPSSKDLIMLLRNYSYLSLGKVYGLSDNAIRKWVKMYGLNPSDYSGHKKAPKFYFAPARRYIRRLDIVKTS